MEPAPKSADVYPVVCSHAWQLINLSPLGAISTYSMVLKNYGYVHHFQLAQCMLHDINFTVHNFEPLWIPMNKFSKCRLFPDLVIFPETCITANKNLGVHKHAVSCGIEVGSTTEGNIQSCLIHVLQ